MEIIRNTGDREELLPGVFKTPKLKTEALEVIELEFHPGSSLRPHDMPCKVAFFVIEGSGTLTYGDRVEVFNAGEMVHLKPGTERYWRNRTDKPFKVLVIKSLGER
ncbi:MAG TPA: cupin domain-containing protein [bacterium]|nr:cupin domain-containing protein [bacterium]